MGDRQIVNVPGVPPPVAYKSMAVRHNELVFVSGQLGKGPDGRPLPTLREQVEQAFTQMSEILEAAGSSLQNLVKISVWVTDIAYLTTVDEVKRELFDADPPASMGAEVVRLALDAMVEIDGIAVAS